MTLNIGFWTDVKSTDVDSIIVNIGILKTDVNVKLPTSVIQITDVGNMNYTQKNIY